MTTQTETFMFTDELMATYGSFEIDQQQARKLLEENQQIKAEREGLVKALQNADALILHLLPGVRNLVSMDYESLIKSLETWQTNRKIIEKLEVNT